MLSQEISSYTKFQFSIDSSVDMVEAIVGIKARVSKLLLEDR